MDQLDHEKLDVYKCSLEFFALTLRVLPRLPRGELEIRDQLRRAALSISLNIAEGTGKPTPADRARDHAIARGSAMECGALLDVCRLAGLVSAEEAARAKALLVRIVAMLTKMCRS
jgi:four helix bundle protein